MVTAEVARLLTELSSEVRRQIGILVGRRGGIEFVIVGDQKSITIPDLSRERTGALRLRGLRLIHTHLQGEPLNQEDLTDLALLRLDMLVALSVGEEGDPGLVHAAHLLPDSRGKKVWEMLPPASVAQMAEIDFLKWVQSLEEEFQRGQRSVTLHGGQGEGHPPERRQGKPGGPGKFHGGIERACRVERRRGGRLHYPETSDAFPGDTSR